MTLAERLAQKYFAKDSSNELLARAIANEALEEAAKELEKYESAKTAVSLSPEYAASIVRDRRTE